MKTRFVGFTQLRTIALGSLLACSDPTGPEAALRGEFVLSSVGGSPLPVVWAWAPDMTYLLLSEKLVFDGKGSVYRERVTSWENTVTGAGGQVTDTFTRDYRIRVDTVEIGSWAGNPCPINASRTRAPLAQARQSPPRFEVSLCEASELGTFTGAELVLDPYPGDRDMVFRRPGPD
jgi:hypothetical protein